MYEMECMPKLMKRNIPPKCCKMACFPKCNEMRNFPKLSQNVLTELAKKFKFEIGDSFDCNAVLIAIKNSYQLTFCQRKTISLLH